MNKLIALISFLTFIPFIQTAVAQDELRISEAQATKSETKIFHLESLDGSNTKVKIIPDYVHRVLVMACLRDTIKIPDFWGVPPEIRLLNRNFIEIKYEVRGGSGLGLGNILIICLNGGKLYEAMHVLRYSSWESGDLKKDYRVKLVLNGDSKSSYKLYARIHDEAYSNPDPQKNYIYNSQTSLRFDTTRNVFYSIKEDVYGHFIPAKKSKTAKQQIDGNFPMIILGKETYYFIDNRWYQPGSGNEMNIF